MAGVERFRARILRQGRNPHVEVPARVGRAFEAFARAGRIQVVGWLGRAPIRATLIPAGDGRHKLFVNGGMQRTAGVAVGDTVTFALEAVGPDEVRPPEDVVAALRKARGAKKAFDALSPSHRRELLRYVDGARSPANRRKRIAETVDRVVGPPPARSARLRARRRPTKPLWTCPRCGNEFVNSNQYHSCRRYRLSDPFAGKSARVRALFDRLRELVEACGPVKIQPYRDNVAFLVRVRFARAVPRKGWLDVALWLPRRVDDARFRRVETIGPKAHVHVLRVAAQHELDRRVAGWIREAYAVGRQEHLGGR